MPIDPLLEFRECISESFSFLFEGQEFRFAKEESHNGSEYRLEIITSANLQIKFLLERITLDMYVGFPDAPRGWKNGANGVTHWHDFSDLATYLDCLDPDQAVRLPPSARGEPWTLLHATTNKAALLQAYLPRLEAAFSPHPPPGWWEGYEAFLTIERIKYATASSSS